MPSSSLPSPFPHIAAAAESADRSPRPTSAPAIAQSQITEGPGVKKTPKEAAKAEVKGEEEPSEQAEPEPTEAWKVCLRNLMSANVRAELQMLSEQQNLTDSHHSCLFSLFPKEIVSH